MTPQSIRSLFTDCAQTDRQQTSQYIPRRSLRSLGGYNYFKHKRTDARKKLG